MSTAPGEEAAEGPWTAHFARAAELARRGEGEVEPNPLVGALALQDGHVVGEGWHEYWGGAHAEENALSAARAAGARPDTVLVTLEPCSSTGGTKKRPPCTRLLLEHGVRRVVIGRADPDPRHAGAAFRTLAAEGVEVLGPFAQPCLAELLVRFEQGLALARPWVVLKWAMTLDGKTGTRSGSSRWISDEPALDWAHRMRSRADAVLVGIGTVLADDPELTVRRVPGPSPLRVVLDPSGELHEAHRLVCTRAAAPLLVLRGEAPGAPLPEDVEVLRVPCEAAPGSPRRRLEPAAVLAALADRGVRRLLVEGGGGVAADLALAGLFDAVQCVVAPRLTGGRAARTPLRGLGVLEMEDSVRLDGLQATPLGSCVLLRAFRRPDA